MDTQEFQKAYGKLVAKAWADEAFKAKLLADPMTVLKENEISAPEGVDVKVVENTDTTVHLILPPAPSSDELSDEQLETLSGGGCAFGIMWAFRAAVVRGNDEQTIGREL